MTSTQMQCVSEEQLARWEAILGLPHPEHYLTKQHQVDLLKEVRRLRQRVVDLETACNLFEGLYREQQIELVVPFEHQLPSFLAQQPESDHGEYARGVRVP